MTESLQREFPSLEVIDRSRQEAQDDGDPGNKATGLEKTKDWARKVGANVIITGRFWKPSQEIWVLISGAEQIVVVKGREYGLEKSAVETVKEWKFKPAVGPDGNPVAVVLVLEITFRLTPPPEARL